MPQPKRDDEDIPTNFTTTTTTWSSLRSNRQRGFGKHRNNAHRKIIAAEEATAFALQSRPFPQDPLDDDLPLIPPKSGFGGGPPAAASNNKKESIKSTSNNTHSSFAESLLQSPPTAFSRSVSSTLENAGSRRSPQDYFDINISNTIQESLFLKPTKPLPLTNRFPSASRRFRRSTSLTLGRDTSKDYNDNNDDNNLFRFPPKLNGKMQRSNSLRPLSTPLEDINSVLFSEENRNPNENLVDIERHKPRKKRRSRLGLLLDDDDLLDSLPHVLDTTSDNMRAMALTCSQPESLDPPELFRSSTASTRKRSVGGSPKGIFNMDLGNDNEEFSIPILPRSKFIRSLSCSYSPTKVHSPIKPRTPSKFDAINSKLSPAKSPKSPAIRHSPSSVNDQLYRRNNDMCDSESDISEDDDLYDSSSPDTSMEDNYYSTHGDTYDDSIYEPTIENLEYLIAQLSTETKKKELKLFVIKSWTVVVPQSWMGARRVEFFRWAQSLGFSQVDLGGGMRCLKIQIHRGKELLQQLEPQLLALQEKQKLQVETSLQSSNEPKHEEKVISSISSLTSPGPMMISAKKPSPLRSSALYGDHDEEETGIELNFNSLSVKDRDEQYLRNFASLDANTSIARSLDSGSQHSYASNARLSIDDSTFVRSSLYSVAPTPMVLGSGVYKKSPSVSFECPPSAQSGCTTTSIQTTNMSTVLPTPINTASACYDFATPLPTLKVGWGSRPIEGRDWGTSEQCASYSLVDLEEYIRDEMMETTMFAEEDDEPSVSQHQADKDFDVESDTSSSEIDDDLPVFENISLYTQKRIAKSTGKHLRMSICHATLSQSDYSLSVREKLFRFSTADTRRESVLQKTLTSEFEFSESTGYPRTVAPQCPVSAQLNDKSILSHVFTFLDKKSRHTAVPYVSKTWFDALALTEATEVASYFQNLSETETAGTSASNKSAIISTKSWNDQHEMFPWACYLSEGGFKKVFKVYNSRTNCAEAVALMDMKFIRDMRTVASEISISIVLSYLNMQRVCPNFLRIHGTYISDYAPPKNRWGTDINKRPNGDSYESRKYNNVLRVPKKPMKDRYFFIRMEYCDEGDAEEYLKRQENSCIDPSLARAILFQAAFALYVAADRHNLKHYDVKLLNLFLKRLESKPGHEGTSDVVLEYAIGRHIFALNMRREDALLVKLADFGTSNMSSGAGQSVTLAQFTTQENTPPDFMILGDLAMQGHEHDSFGLGLCFLHLYTGHAPYEEIMKDVICPPNLKKRLKKIWESPNTEGYKVIRSCILSDVYKDEAGHIIEGEPDEALYHTLYRFLVLFGIPDSYKEDERPLVWKAIREALLGQFLNKRGKASTRTYGTDVQQFQKDQEKFNIQIGDNWYIARARKALSELPGGMDLLTRLCHFDPSQRAGVSDVINSDFMAVLKKEPSTVYDSRTEVHSYLAYATK